MEQKKMHCAVQSNYRDNQSVYEGGKFYAVNEYLENDNFRASLENSEISSLNLRNSDKRCAVLTVYTPESVGLWRIVAEPSECLDHTNLLGSVAQAKMDGLHLVSPSSVNSFNVDWCKTWKEHLRDVTYPDKSFTPRRFPGSDVQQQSRNRTLANKVTNLNDFSSNSSSQSSITWGNSSSAIQRGSRSFKSSSVFIEKPEVDNALNMKRNLRNKATKKWKKNRKVSCSSVSAEPEVLSEEYAHGVLTSETSGNIDMDYGDGLVSSATSLEDSFLGNRINNRVEDDNNGISNSSESPKTCTSYIDEVNLSEAEVPSSILNFPRSLTDSRMLIEMEGQGSVTDGVAETHPLQISCCNGTHSNGFSDMHDCRVLDSASVGSNSGNSTSATYDAKTYERESNKSTFSESVDFRSIKGSLSPMNLLSSVVGFRDYTERERYGNQGLNCGDLQVAVPGKQKKKAKMVPGISNSIKPRSARNSRVHTRKENNHCVWQKVQKNTADECNSESKKASDVCSRFHGTLKEPSSLRRNNSCSQRATYPSRTGSNAHDKIGSQQNEILHISELVNNQKRVSSAPRSRSQIVSPEFEFQISKGESLNSESSLSSQDSPQSLESTESVSNTVSSMKEHQDSSLETSCHSLDKMNVLEVCSPFYLPHLIVNEVAQTEKDISLAENGKQNHIPGSLLQKWMPIGTKDPQSTTSLRCGSLHLAHTDGQGAEAWTMRNIVNEKAASNSQNLISSLNVGMMSMGLDSESNFLHEDENNNREMRNPSAHAFKENTHVASDWLIDESKDKKIYAFETDVNKIVQAVDNACRMQAASEAVQIAIGGPIAEFERFLHSSSPAICCSRNLIGCKNFSENQVVGASLCRLGTPNVSLGCLWQWYEKHGSCGLEIRAEDHEQSNRLGVDRFSFRAYFVPFFSAVQLFRNCKSNSSNSGHGFPNSEASGTAETGKNLQSSGSIGHLPIFSVLFPQPRTLDASSLPPVKDFCKSEQSSVSGKDYLAVPSIDMTRSDDLELLFECFESEQPRQRRPLYERIQELVTGERSSNCSMYGDPTNLNTINLHDLHPTSWYAVAWYPIYRIPDGNFRAAFLTYHSLGHMVHRSRKNDSGTREACIVFPAAGLQSYNAQSECWFQLRHSASSQTDVSSSLNPSGILKERLRTLEETASVISRAVVNKGNQTSVNRHSDFEFFLSRRHIGLP